MFATLIQKEYVQKPEHSSFPGLMQGAGKELKTREGLMIHPKFSPPVVVPAQTPPVTMEIKEEVMEKPKVTRKPKVEKEVREALRNEVLEVAEKPKRVLKGAKPRKLV